MLYLYLVYLFMSFGIRTSSSLQHYLHANTSLTNGTDIYNNTKLSLSLNLSHSTEPETTSVSFANIFITPTTEPLFFGLENTSKTLKDIINEDNHRYYTSRLVQKPSFWVAAESMYKAGKHPSLSESYRSAATITLSFPFKFYGHEVNQVTIATGGFLYVSDFLHQWLTATQYIAPLMANFDTQIGNNSHIRYWDSGSMFVVWWEDVYLQDDYAAGKFSFQVVLHNNGTIVFNYKEVAKLDISDKNHRFTIGLSDAFSIDEDFEYLKQRTIYEYHRVEINISMINNYSSIVITPLTSCIEMKSCGDCMLASTSFDCQWCSSLQHCSDGMDRRRQQWLLHQCDKKYISNVNDCKFWPHALSKINIATFVVMFFLIFFVIFITCWIVYAYRYPNSPSGLWLIEHHPSHLQPRLRSCLRRLRNLRLPTNKFNVAMHSEVESLASA